MPDRRMHPGQPATDVALVRRLLASQFPEWAGLPIRSVASDGTTNSVYRLGTRRSVRLPLVRYGEAAIDVERNDLPRVAPHLPLRAPTQLAVGAPGAGYPFRWSVHAWLEGTPLSRRGQQAPAVDLAAIARDLAAWIAALRRIDPSGARDAVAHDLRGAPLALRDDETRRGIERLADEIDVGAAHAVWEQALCAEPWGRAPVWCHGDLLPGNLLARGGRLAAVLDFAGLGVGDPACDLMIAWDLFAGASRAAFRDALRDAVGLDGATWARGRGHALYHAAIYVPYYRDTNPAGTAAARRLLAAVLADAE